jgi:hypothetical protein
MSNSFQSEPHVAEFREAIALSPFGRLGRPDSQRLRAADPDRGDRA